MKEGLTGKKRVKGQSTLELLIALTIIIVSVAAAVAVFFGAQSLSVDAELSSEATYLAKQALEQARSLARQNFDALGNSSSTQGEFSIATTVETVGDDTKEVTVSVEWQTDPLREQSVEVITLVTDWRNIAPPPDPDDGGGGGLSGDWRNPRTLGSVDLGPGNSATDLDVINKIVYMTAEASAAAKPDFFIVDATDGQSPVIASSLNTGPSLNAVDATKNYAYAANNDRNAQLQVINIANIAAPSLVSSFRLPEVTGTGAVGHAIFYTDSKVYIGTLSSTGPEFHIVDVSNPGNPQALGSREMGVDIDAIYVSGDLAYVATTASDEVKVLDVSSPSNIVEVGSFDAPGDDEDGESIQLVGSRLYLGRTRGANHASHHELHVLNAGDPSSIQDLGSVDLAADVNDLYARDNLIFLGTNDANKEFQVWDISNPASIAFWSSFNFPQIASGVDYEDNLVYVAVRSNDALRIITSSP